MRCSKCNTHFKYVSLLNRHLTNKKKCTTIESTDTKAVKCKYCMKVWSGEKACKRHESSCCFKDDVVRHLELQLAVKLTFEHSNDTCRFCNKAMLSNNLYRHTKTCKVKTLYKMELLKQIDDQRESKGHTTNIYNISNCNNTTNVNVLPFGKENLEYITADVIANIMRKALCQFAGKEEKYRFIRQAFKEIFANEKHPENHNMLIRSMKGGTASMWNGNEFEERHRKKIEEKALTTIANVTSENYWDEPEKFKNYKRFCDRYIVGEEAIDGDTENDYLSKFNIF